MTERGCDCVGIDLGTTYSSLAYMDRQLRPRMVSDSSGQAVVPSIVYFDDAGVVVGDVALQQASICAERVVQFVKSHMGDAWKFDFQGHTHTPESISALLLRYLVRESEPQIGSVRRAVITVPAYFTEKRRRATQQAGEIAGLEVIGTLNEPMAATLAHRLDEVETEQTVIVYDLGGGTFDVTVVRITPTEIIEIATNGNRQLGGRDWDQCLIDMVAEDFERAHQLDLRDHAQSLQDVRVECEKAKRRLGGVARTQIRFHALGFDHVTEVTREQFEDRSASLLQATKLTTEMALEDASLHWKSISKVVLVGGSTNMPAVRRMIEQMSSLQPLVRVNPMFAVALGAAIYGWLIESGHAIKTVQQRPPTEPDADVEPIVESPESTAIIVPKQTGRENLLDDIGESASEEKSAEEPSPVVETPKARPPVFAPFVAPTIRFVTAHGVGVKVRDQNDWKNAVVIPKNSRVPAQAQKRFFTVAKSGAASHVRIEVTQGDTVDIELAEVLGIGRIDCLRRNDAPGQPVDVLMDFDEEGRLHIRAIYANTGEEMKMTLDIPGGLRPEEVEQHREHVAQTEFLSLFNPDSALAGLDEVDDDE